MMFVGSKPFFPKPISTTTLSHDKADEATRQPFVASVDKGFSISDKKSDISSLLSKVTDFLTTGDLEKPDPVQRQAMSRLLKEIFSLREKPRERLASTLDDISRRPGTAVVVVPRLNWLIDQMVLFAAFQKTLTMMNRDGRNPVSGHGP